MQASVQSAGDSCSFGCVAVVVGILGETRRLKKVQSLCRKKDIKRWGEGLGEKRKRVSRCVCVPGEQERDARMDLPWHA